MQTKLAKWFIQWVNALKQMFYNMYEGIQNSFSNLFTILITIHLLQFYSIRISKCVLF